MCAICIIANINEQNFYIWNLLAVLPMIFISSETFIP